MALFFGRRQDISLIIDVGSASVGAALVAFTEGKEPHVLRSTRVQLKFQQYLKYQRFMELMFKAFDGAVEAVMDGGLRPSRVYCFLASPWYVSEVRNASVRDEKGFAFDRTVLEQMVADEGMRFEEEAVRNYHSLKEPVRFIEQKVIDVKQNGYNTPTITPGVVKEVQFSVLYGLSPEAVVGEIERRLAAHLPEVPVIFHSFVLPFFAVLRDVFHGVKDALLIDVGGEMTDVSLMKSETLADSVSFPLGRNFLFRKLTTALKKDLEEAQSFLKLHLEGKLTAEARRMVSEALFPVEREWIKGLREALDELGSSLVIPHEIFLFADGDIVKWFIDAIKKEDYTQYARTADKFNVTTIGASVLGKHLSLEPGTERDQFLALESVFIGASRP